MTGQSFFAVVQTFLGVTPALVYLVAGFLIAAGDERVTRGHARRVHHAAGAAAVPDGQPAAGLAGRADLAGPVRAASSSTSTCTRDRRRARRAPARPGRGHRPGRVARRVVRLPGGGGAGHRGGRRRGARRAAVGASRTCRSPSSRASSPRSSGPAGRARPRSPTWSRGSTTSTAGAVLLDGHDVRDLTLDVAGRRRRDGHPGDLPVPRDRRATTSLRQARRHPGGDRGRRRAPRTSTTGS